MEARQRVRVGTAVVIGVVAAGAACFGIAVVYGLTLEYGGGALGELGLVVVLVPTVLAALAVAAWPAAARRWQVGVPLAVAVTVVLAGLAAQALGEQANRDRLLEESRSFGCNGPNAELLVHPRVERTWQRLPRRAPVYGPIEASATHCVGGVAGDGEQSFVAYTSVFRDLGWEVVRDEPQLFEMTRDGVRVTVALQGHPDRLTTIAVAVTDGRASRPSSRGTIGAWTPRPAATAPATPTASST